MTYRSMLYQGRVTHTRLSPFKHRFSYRVFYGLFDLDELNVLDRELRFFSIGRFNLFGFNLADYGPGDGSALRPWVEQTLAGAGVDLDGGRIALLTFPRILGYVFNPLSIWYCYGPEDDLRAVIHEVRNTFGDRHSYVVPILGDDLVHSFGKQLHVSPFNGMDQGYQFTISPPSSRISVSIEQSEKGTRFFRAGLALSRMPLSDSNLIRLFVTHPLVSLKVISAIHWQALRLWIKGATFHRRPEPAADSISIIRSRSAVG